MRSSPCDYYHNICKEGKEEGKKEGKKMIGLVNYKLTGQDGKG